MPGDLAPILRRVIGAIDVLSDGINAGVLGVTQWHNDLAQLLLVGHTAAYLEGRGADALTPGARRLIAEIVGDQVRYLNGFAEQVDAAGWNDARDRARAALYAGSLKQAFWRGATFGLDLPYYPGDGSSECLGNCGCRWRVVWIDQEDLDADCFWELGGPERHCTTCPQRAAAGPIRFRGGERQ
jgi:hypothetical protein